jgi:hypothetical protein
MTQPTLSTAGDKWESQAAAHQNEFQGHLFHMKFVSACSLIIIMMFVIIIPLGLAIAGRPALMPVSVGCGALIAVSTLLYLMNKAITWTKL